MLGCPSCGSFLRFDIDLQKLKCDYCGNTYAVDEVTKLRSARTVDEMPENAGEEAGGWKKETAEKLELYSFICPQCGGTVYGGRQDMTGFCCYCGSPVELAGRLTEIESPKGVIPFSVNKEQCTEAFLNMVRKTPFLPAGYSDKEHIDSFIGIYMPYWLYHVNCDGSFSAPAEGSKYRSGDYIITNMYSVNCNLDGDYHGFEHDASSTFDDGISEAIGPFRTGDKQEFREGYISGFYADASDMKATVFRRGAEDTVKEEVFEKVYAAAKDKKGGIKMEYTPGIRNNKLAVDAEKVMYPVWFMAYRNKDRVAYAAVNGQTGKITADLPIDNKKFLISSLLTAIPIFLLLELFAFMMPSTLLLICSIACVLSVWLQRNQSKRIAAHEGLLGYAVKKPAAGKKKKRKHVDVGLICVLVYLSLFALPLLITVRNIVIPIASAAVALFFAISLAKDSRGIKDYGVPFKGTLTAFISVAAILVTLIIRNRPVVSDLWFWGGSIALLACIVSAMLCIIQNYNIMATRRPAQFNKEGGAGND